MQVTKFERWDFPSTTVRLQILRLYLGKILNLLLNVAGYGLLVARQGPAMQFELALVEPDDARYGCAENQVGAMLFLFVVVEFVVDKLATLGRIAVRKHVLPALTGAAYTREPFPTAQKVNRSRVARAQRRRGRRAHTRALPPTTQHATGDQFDLLPGAALAVRPLLPLHGRARPSAPLRDFLL